MDVRIVDCTPAPSRGLEVWQLETRLHPDAPWHRSHEGQHTSNNPQTLRDLAQSEEWTVVWDASVP